MPQTIEDLGRLVKAKHPGAYDDMPDAAVGQKVKARFPGSYDDFTDAPAPEAKSLGGFGSNIVSSAGRLVGDVVRAAVHPIDTLDAAGAIPAGIIEKTAKALGAPVGDKSGSKAFDGSSSKMLDSILDHFKERYGSLEGVKKTLYNDPAGVMADLATVAGGAGGALKGVGLAAEAAGAARTASRIGTAAKVAGNVAKLADPVALIAAPVRGAARVVGAPLVEAVGNKLYQSALKPSMTNTIEELQSMVKTGRREGLNPGDAASYQKLQGLIADVRQQIDAGIQSHAGATVDPAAVASRVDQIRPQFNTFTPEADVKAIEATKAEFLRQHTPPAPQPSGLLNAQGQPIPAAPAPGPRPIPIAETQELKTRTSARLNQQKAYGEVKSASEESLKALVRGAKEEVERIFPEITALNERQGALMGLEPELERAIKRIGNKDLISIGDGATLMLKKILDDPKFKAKLSIGLEMAQRRVPGPIESTVRTVGGRMQVVNSRITEFIDRMNAVEAAGQQQNGGLAPALAQ